MSTLVTAYLIFGAIVGLLIWWASFNPGYDQFVKDHFREQPPTTREKWITVLSSPILWPLYLWYAFR